MNQHKELGGVYMCVDRRDSGEMKSTPPHIINHEVFILEDWLQGAGVGSLLQPARSIAACSFYCSLLILLQPARSIATCLSLSRH